MKTALVGAVESTEVTLEAWAEAGRAPDLLVTLPRERSGRHSDFRDLRPLAHAHDVPVLEASDVNAPEVVERLRAVAPDYVMVIGWSQICRADVLGVARRGNIGYHPAPLPELRGRAVIPWTILQERSETGSTLFWMDEGMDSGDILAQQRFPVSMDETASTLYQKHMGALRSMWRGVLPGLLRGEMPKTPQDHARATYCARRTAADGRIDWSRPAREVWTLIRAVGAPYPGAFTTARGRKMTVWRAEYIGEAPYIGLQGQVQRLSDEGIVVRCGDGEHVLLTEVAMEDGSEREGWPVRNHEKLGEPTSQRARSAL